MDATNEAVLQGLRFHAQHAQELLADAERNLQVRVRRVITDERRKTQSVKMKRYWRRWRREHGRV